jgi:glucose-1-phosphate thymidylyltransferase
MRQEAGMGGGTGTAAGTAAAGTAATGTAAAGTARRGIILAGGSGSRLHPITQGVSKQLLPVYDKPMIYYPLSVLMLAGIREIAVITTPEDQGQFRRLLGDGSQWGLAFAFLVQPRPEGLAQAYTIAEAFLDGRASVMVLGDNIFFGHGLPQLLAEACAAPAGGTVFGYQVADPERYGVVAFDAAGRAVAIEEKPARPASSYALTGLYVLDASAPARAARVTPSARGELEIVSLLQGYLDEGALDVRRMGRGYAWLDTGTHASLLDAGNFVRTLQARQGLQVGCPEEIAFQQGWIGRAALAARAAFYGRTDYGRYLARLVE